jgi:hypothetical protein
MTTLPQAVARRQLKRPPDRQARPMDIGMDDTPAAMRIPIGERRGKPVGPATGDLSPIYVRPGEWFLSTHEGEETPAHAAGSDKESPN